MFEADQFHQFIDSRTTTTAAASSNSLPLLLTFPNSAFSTFDSFSSSSSTSSSTSCISHPHVSLPPNFLHQTPPKTEHKEQNTNTFLPMNLETEERDRSIPDQSIDPWSTDELLTLFRIRSSMENWFPDFTWDHVSRKLAEFGFKKSAEKCKEKFEEESRYLNNISSTTNFSKSYRVFGDFEDLYNHSDNNNNNPNQNQNPQPENNKQAMDKATQEEDKIEQTVVLELDQKEKLEANEKSENRKRKREKNSSSSPSSSSFEMFKGFCQDIISKIIAQQEEMHSKLLEDMAKRDEEKIAREEEWKKQEMDRLDKELQLRAQQQALNSDRQTTIINFLKKFSSDSSTDQILAGDKSNSNSSSSSSLQNPNPNSKPEPPIPHKDSNFLTPKSNPIKPNSIPNERLPKHQKIQNPNSQFSSSTQNPNPIQNSPLVITSNDNQKDDLGKRWPKDEVLALINLRCSLYNSNEEEKESSTSSSVKAPLWERISKGMMEKGYKRSAKRCKEKWENINKYYRKTKDVNKKRSLDSRTCPYFHQLSTLYNQGKLVASSDVGTQSSSAPPNNTSTNSTLIQVAQGDKNLVHQASGFEFEF